MLQIVNQSDEEKFKMYSKLSKKELIYMLIEANKHLQNKELTISYTELYYNSCPCNPENGGSGICHCTLGSSITYNS